MPKIQGLKVVRSSIHGYGVVATRDFQEGELIAEVEGVLWTWEEVEDDTYCLWIDDDHYLDMVDQTRWVNHSCDPNCDIQAELDGKGGAWAKIYASRDIAAGDELTYDYGFPVHLAEKCGCGARNCRGWIVDAEELPALQKKLERRRAAAKRARERRAAARAANGDAGRSSRPGGTRRRATPPTTRTAKSR